MRTRCFADRPSARSIAVAVAAGLAGMAVPGPAQPPPAAAMPAGPIAADIVGGREATPGAWPWQVAILDAGARNPVDGQFCAGALIDPGWVVTAVHCVTEVAGDAEIPIYANDIVVGLGVHDLKTDRAQVVPVAQIFTNPDYFDETTDDWGDIALLRLGRPATLGPAVQPIALVADPADAAIAPGGAATVIGWGMTETGATTRLRQVEVPIVDPAACELNASIVCAGARDRDACYGDSGGPLMVAPPGGGPWRLAGVVSSGTTDTCGGPGNHTLYTSTAYYADWIAATLQDTAAALEVEKLAPTVVGYGEVIDYALVVRNVGREPATDIVIRDALPDGVTFVAADNGGSRNGRLVTWRLGSLAGESAVQLGLTVRHTAGFGGDARAFDNTDGWRTRIPSRRPGHRHGTAPRPGAEPAISVDIVGGRVAAEGAWPWQVALIDRRAPNPREGLICGGSLIAADKVLTAAHCVLDPESGAPLPAFLLEVKVGSNVLSDGQGERIGVARVWDNLRYLIDEEADIAIVDLERPAALSARVQPVAIGTDADAALWAAGQVGTVTGWGDRSGNGDYPDPLHEVDLPIADAVACGQHADSETTLCAGPEAGGKSACFGDSGGPFVVPRGGGFVLAGVVSRGSADGCGAPGALSLFARPAAFAAWIAEKTGPSPRPDLMIVNWDYSIAAAGMLPRPGLPAFTVVSGPGVSAPSPTTPPGPTTPPTATPTVSPPTTTATATAARTEPTPTGTATRPPRWRIRLPWLGKSPQR